MSSRLDSNARENLAREIRDALGSHNDQEIPVVALVRKVVALAAAPPAPAAEPAAIGEIDASDDGYFVELYPDRGLKLGAKVYTAPPPVEASQPAAHEPEWALWQFQRADGTWSQFMDERHYQNTRDSDGWNMRRIVRVVESSQQQQCPCGDREASKCPGEWEPGCDLGANEKFARRVDEASQQQAEPASGYAATCDALAKLVALVRERLPDFPDCDGDDALSDVANGIVAYATREPASGEASQLLRDIDDLIEDAELSGWRDRSAYKLAKAAHAKLAAELSRLTAGLAAAKAEVGKLTQIADLRWQAIEDLTKERDDAVATRVELIGQASKAMGQRDAARAEAEALRKALQEIAAEQSGTTATEVADRLQSIAKAALAAQQGEKP